MITLLLQCCPSTAQIVKCSCDNNNAATSCNDVTIAAIICGAIVLVALIASICFWRWTGKKYGANSEQNNPKNTDCEEKQKWELTGRLLDFLEKRSYNEEYNENSGKIEKKYKPLSDEECKYYLETLINLIGKKDVSVFSK